MDIQPQLQTWDAPAPIPTNTSRTRKRTRHEGEDVKNHPKKALFTESDQLREYLGRDWYFSHSFWRGEEYFHFRVHEEKNGILIPMPKGICLKPPQMKQLIDCATTLNDSAEKAFHNATLKEYAVHLGYGCYITVRKENGKWFDIRQFFKPDGCNDPIHTRKGAMLRTEEFTRFIGLIPKILEYSPTLMAIQVCDCIYGGNPMTFFTCKACNPFDAGNW